MTPADLQRFRNGDQHLFRTLVETESPRLLRFAVWLCGEEQEAQDLVQDTWVTAFLQREAFDGRAPLLSWLTVICRSRFLSGKRTERRRMLLLHSHSQREPGSRAWHAGTDPLMRRRLAEALGGLPDRQRDVIVLRLVEGLSTRDCANRLGVPEGTIKSALARGLATLRPLLEEYHS